MRLRWGIPGIAGFLVLAACVGDEPAADDGDASAGTDGGADGSVDGSSSDGGSDAGVDAQPPPPGTVLWVRHFDVDDTPPGDIFYPRGAILDPSSAIALPSIASSADGSVAFAGLFYGSVDFGGGHALTQGGAGENAFVAKLDANGNTVWAKEIEGGSIDFAKAVAMNDTGDVFFLGATASPAFTIDGKTVDNPNDALVAYVAKLDSATGTAQWVYNLGSNASTTDVRGAGIAVHGTEILIAATYAGTMTVHMNGSNPTVASSGRDAFIALLDDTHAGVVSSYATCGGTGDDFATGVAFDGSQNAILVGNFPSAAFSCSISGASMSQAGSAPDSYAVAFNPTLSAIAWSTDYGGAGASSRIAYLDSVAADNAGDAFFAGRLYDDATFGVKVATSNGGADGFVARVTSSGATGVFANPIGGSLDDWSTGIATSGAGASYVVGAYSSSGIILGSTTLPNPQSGASGAFIQSIGANNVAGWAGGAASSDAGETAFASSVAVDPTSGAVFELGGFVGNVDLGDGKVTTSAHAGTKQSAFVVKRQP